MRTSAATLFGMILGLLVGYTGTVGSLQAPATPQVLVEGHGRAITSLRPPGETFMLYVRTPPVQSFMVVPRGKKFILTDVIYIAQGSLRQLITVNIASADSLSQTHRILFQVKISPDESDDVHLCSGYVIPAGHSLTAFTNAGPAADQYVSISVSGYLADE